MAGTAITVALICWGAAARFGRDTKTLEDTTKGLSATNAKMETEVRALRSELVAPEEKIKRETAEKRAELSERLGRDTTDIKTSLENLEKRFDRRMGEVESAIRELTNTVVRMDERTGGRQRGSTDEPMRLEWRGAGPLADFGLARGGVEPPVNGNFDSVRTLTN